MSVYYLVNSLAISNTRLPLNLSAMKMHVYFMCIALPTVYCLDAQIRDLYDFSEKCSLNIIFSIH